MSFPRYPKYKASGVEWLGDVPEHWDVVPIKWLSPVKRGASPRPIDDPIYFDEEGEYAWVRIADVSACDGVLRDTTQRLSELGSSLSVKISPGELFISIAGTVGKPCIAGMKACIHDGFVHFPTLKVEPRFLYRIFEGGVCYGGLGKWGTQLNLNTDTVGSIRVALPPANEVAQLMEFLDRETAKIDKLVAEQRRLMELLKEKRQAVISHAVTKGLNPHAPTKPSGIEWLGEVPVGWDIGPIKYFVVAKNGAIKTGPFGSHLTSSDMQAGPIKVYNQRTVIDCDFVSGDNYISEDKFAELANFETFPGDLLITTRGTIGRAAILPKDAERGILHPCLLRLQPNSSKIDVVFLKTLIQDSELMKTQLSYLSNATTIEVIYSNTIASVVIPVPPLSEQRQILKFIADELLKFDTLTTEAQRAIDLLQERRTALISAAVTGQIDVRAKVDRVSQS